MDVVVSVPVAVAIQSAFLSHGFEAAQRRRTTVLVCAALTATWLLGFKAGQPLLSLPSVLAWGAVLGTLWWPLSRYRASSRAHAGQRDGALRDERVAQGWSISPVS